MPRPVIKAGDYVTLSGKVTVVSEGAGGILRVTVAIVGYDYPVTLNADYVEKAK